MATNTLTPFPYTMSSVTGISPLTYRDAETFLEQLETLKHWLATVNIPEVEAILANVLTEAQAGVGNAEATVTEAKEGWQTLFDEFMVNVAANIGVINNAVIDGRITAGITGKLDKTEAATTYQTKLDATQDGVEALETFETKADATTKQTANAATYATKVQTGTDIATAIAGIKADPLEPWKTAVQAQKTVPAIYVNLGDSIANGGNPTTETRNWLWRVKNLYTSKQMERINEASFNASPGNGVTFYTGAVGGLASANYVTDTIVARIGSIQPKLISHIVGTNDIAQNINPVTYRANIKSWVDKIAAVSPNTVHLFIHVPERIDGLVSGFPWADYGTQLKALAAEYGSKGVYLDVDAEFRKYGPTGTTDRSNFWHADNLHFNNAGNKALAEIVGDKIGAPRNNLIPRELVRGTQLPPATATTNTVISTLTIDARPYLREGMVSVNYYCGATAGTGDVHVKYRPVGESEAGAKVIRLNSAVVNHSIDLYVSLDPHKDYVVEISTDVYGSGTITFGGSGPYYSFVADVSPS